MKKNKSTIRPMTIAGSPSEQSGSEVLKKTNQRAFRGSILHFFNDPQNKTETENSHLWEYIEDGCLVIENGLIHAVGHAADIMGQLPTTCPVIDHRGDLIVPGFVDPHIHFPQLDTIASPGTDLIDWLNRYAFPTEAAFQDKTHATAVAEFFIEELIRNGTTSALVFGTVHRTSIESFFAVAQRKKMRMVGGKVLMDRHCPRELQDTPESGYADSQALIHEWHGRDRLQYAITPRFAITSSDEQLALTGKLAQENPRLIIHTHLAENHEEINWVRQLFPRHRSYLDVYDQYGLVNQQSVFAHCIYLDDADLKRMQSSGATAIFCPTSNLFLGSGLFDIKKADEAQMPFGVATDVGGGTSFNLLRTLSEAYKVNKLQGQFLSPLRAFYLMTLGGARALHLDSNIGNFMPGKEADFVVLSRTATPLMERKLSQNRSKDGLPTLTEQLFTFVMLGDDRAIKQTYIMGEAAKVRSA